MICLDVSRSNCLSDLDMPDWDMQGQTWDVLEAIEADVGFQLL